MIIRSSTKDTRRTRAKSRIVGVLEAEDVAAKARLLLMFRCFVLARRGRNERPRH